MSIAYRNGEVLCSALTNVFESRASAIRIALLNFAIRKLIGSPRVYRLDLQLK